MPGEFEDKIRDIGEMLGFTDIPDSVTDLIGSLAQSFVESSDSEEIKQSDEAAEDTLKALPEICQNCEQESSDDLNTATKGCGNSSGSISDAMKLMDLISKYQSARIAVEADRNLQLLRALSPYLSKKRRKRIRNCEKMITILNCFKGVVGKCLAVEITAEHVGYPECEPEVRRTGISQLTEILRTTKWSLRKFLLIVKIHAKRNFRRSGKRILSKTGGLSLKPVQIECVRKNNLKDCCKSLQINFPDSKRKI